jgi:hypothetical protein
MVANYGPYAKHGSPALLAHKIRNVLNNVKVADPPAVKRALHKILFHRS